MLQKEWEMLFDKEMKSIRWLKLTKRLRSIAFNKSFSFRLLQGPYVHLSLRSNALDFERPFFVHSKRLCGAIGFAKQTVCKANSLLHSRTCTSTYKASHPRRGVRAKVSPLHIYDVHVRATSGLCSNWFIFILVWLKGNYNRSFFKKLSF